MDVARDEEQSRIASERAALTEIVASLLVVLAQEQLERQKQEADRGPVSARQDRFQHVLMDEMTLSVDCVGLVTQLDVDLDRTREQTRLDQGGRDPRLDQLSIGGDERWIPGLTQMRTQAAQQLGVLRPRLARGRRDDQVDVGARQREGEVPQQA